MLKALLSRLPHLPLSCSLVPLFFKLNLVPKGIHRFPETVMAVGNKLTIPGQTGKRLFLPEDIITFNVIKYLWFQYEKNAVDPGAITLRLFLETLDKVGVSCKGQRAETARGLDRRYGSVSAVLFMERKQLLNIHIGYTITVGHHEGFVSKIFADAFYSSSGLGVQAGITRVTFQDSALESWISRLLLPRSKVTSELCRK